MKITKQMREHIQGIALEVARVWVQSCGEMWDDEKDTIHEDEPRYTFKQYTNGDWQDNGYEALDDLSMAIDKAVKREIKEILKGA